MTPVLPSGAELAERLRAGDLGVAPAVLNLVENAMIHTPAGTPVVVSVRARDATVILEVADRGPGVAAERRERIFERFARDAGDRTPVSGSGLGLAIVRAVAEAHDGGAAVGEAEGGGALFTITLPAAAALVPSGSTPRRRPAAPSAAS